MKKVGITNEDIEPNEHVDKEYNPDQDKPGNSGGAPTKDFEQLGRRMKLKRLDPLKKFAEKTVKKNRGLTVGKALAFVSEVVANSEGNADAARMYRAIQNEENPLKNKRMTVEKAVATKVQRSKYNQSFSTIKRG